MEEIILYKCEICGGLHENKILCEQCEKSHLRIKKIIEAKYDINSHSSKSKKYICYPKIIKVEFDGGYIGAYELVN